MKMMSIGLGSEETNAHLGKMIYLCTPSRFKLLLSLTFCATFDHSS
jgi:hypothetical protein